MSDVEVREIDVQDVSALRAWWETSRVPHECRPIDVCPPWEQSQEALPLATHAALMAAEPTCRLVTTDNADANAQMNAVNDQLGYRLVEQQLEVQKTL